VIYSGHERPISHALRLLYYDGDDAQLIYGDNVHAWATEVWGLAPFLLSSNEEGGKAVQATILRLASELLFTSVRYIVTSSVLQAQETVGAEHPPILQSSRATVNGFGKGLCNRVQCPHTLHCARP
jgi:hypothetical protein